jgi:hypothetical protein
MDFGTICLLAALAFIGYGFLVLLFPGDAYKNDPDPKSADYYWFIKNQKK